MDCPIYSESEIISGKRPNMTCLTKTMLLSIYPIDYTHFEGLFLIIINFKCKSWQESNSASRFFPKRLLSGSS